MLSKLPHCLLLQLFVSVSAIDTTCSRIVYLAKAEQKDPNGLRCWDTVKVPTCGGRCLSKEIPDWEFPYKKSYHPVCVYNSRKPLVVKLRHCDLGVEPGTEMFYYVAAEDCKCKMCSSQYTSCEWLPPNATLLEGISEYFDINARN